MCCDAELDTLSRDSRLCSESVFIHNIFTLSAFVTLGVIPTLYSRDTRTPDSSHSLYFQVVDVWLRNALPSPIHLSRSCDICIRVMDTSKCFFNESTFCFKSPWTLKGTLDARFDVDSSGIDHLADWRRSLKICVVTFVIVRRIKWRSCCNNNNNSNSLLWSVFMSNHAYSQPRSSSFKTRYI